jgi:hypothetical protein
MIFCIRFDLGYAYSTLTKLLILAGCILSSSGMAAPFKQDLSLQGITFHLSSENAGSQNQLTITIDGLKSKTDPILHEIDGAITGAEVGDLNSDGSPEVYVYTTSIGSGSYGNVTGVSVNKMKSASDIFMPPITENKQLSAGYMGHDEFAVIEGTLVRRFPIYKAGDTNAKATSGLRQVNYKLKSGEAGWVLRIKNSMDFK